MNNIIFINTCGVEKIHTRLIDAFGGHHGVRDMHLLESALGQATVTFAGELLHSDLASMAAAYLFHIVKNHPFYRWQ